MLQTSFESNYTENQSEIAACEQKTTSDKASFCSKTECVNRSKEQRPNTVPILWIVIGAL